MIAVDFALPICDELDRQFTDPLLVSCSGNCAQQRCTVGSPCTITPPGGAPALCTSGFMCASPGSLCSPGVICDCHCTQTFNPRLATCSCGCEW